MLSGLALARRCDLDRERRGPYDPLDDAYDLVALTRDEVQAFLDADTGDAMGPRCAWMVVTPDGASPARWPTNG